MTETLLGGGRYRLQRVLGHGGMASVYLAQDSALERTVAIKVVSEAFAADVDARRRLVREARLAARLSHPNIVRIYDIEAVDERPYLVLEHVDGPTLAEELGRRGRLPPAEVARIGRQVSAGLAHAHTAGLVHRDVKSRNLLCAGDGTVKIADFGIARAADSTEITLAGTVLGTASYLAPEQARGDPVTPAADVYSLGVVLYELLTGRPPYTADSLAELVSRQAQGKVAPPSRANTGVSQELDSIVLACLSSDPEARPTSAQLGGALARALSEGEPTTSLPAPGPLAAPRPKGLSRLKALVSAPAWPRRLRRPDGIGRKPALLAAAAILAAGLAAGIGLTAGAGGTQEPAQARVNPVPPVPRSDDPAELARSLAAWLRDHAG
jgi:eukaryotic-like serine/threonine-protein kinase